MGQDASFSFAPYPQPSPRPSPSSTLLPFISLRIPCSKPDSHRPPPSRSSWTVRSCALSMDHASGPQVYPSPASPSCPPPVLTSLASPLGLAPSQLSRSSSRTPTSSATMMESCVPPRRLPLASRSQTDTTACLEKRVRSDPCRPSKPWTTLTSPSSRSSSRRVASRAIDATEACPWVSTYVWRSPSPSDHLPPPCAFRLISSRPHLPLPVGLAHQDPQVRQGRRRRHPEGCR